MGFNSVLKELIYYIHDFIQHYAVKANSKCEEIIGDHRCGFWTKRSTTGRIFCISQIRDTKWEYNEAVHQLFIDCKKAYDSFRREDSYNIPIDAVIPTMW